ncbi:MAG: head GIN domain-containing protein [Moheibacter sp.]
MKPLFLSIFSIFFLISCAQETIRGNRDFTTETRQINTNFDTLESSGAFEITINDVPQDGKIKLEGDSNILEKIKVETKENKLIIEYEKGFNIINNSRSVKISLNAQNMKALGLSGSGKINMLGTNNVDSFHIGLSGSGSINAKTISKDVIVGISGSGDVNLDGQTKNLKVGISGSGDVDTFNLNAINSQISVSGSGDVKINVSGNLTVNSSGSGDVFYKGNPKSVVANSNGSGDVIASN